jgi:hypothetical protein
LGNYLLLPTELLILRYKCVNVQRHRETPMQLVTSECIGRIASISPKQYDPFRWV